MTTPPAEFQAVLGPYRDRIDALDRQIVKLLCDRLAVVREVAGVKAEHGIPVMLPDRVEIVLDHVTELARGQGGSPESVRKIYSEIIKIACEIETSLIDDHPARA